MRIILSRKGFDSANGGMPSPILPNNTILSLPIPSTHDTIRFTDLQLTKSLNYFSLISSLQKKFRKNLILSSDTCHLDPDIYPEIIKRDKEWKPLFGQKGASQTHLTQQGITKGDLFLFFGWFRNTICREADIIFDKTRKFSLHIIFGYFQIGRIIKEESEIEEWMRYHPHVSKKDQNVYKNNCLYIARDKLSWNKDLPGAGPFIKYNESLILTKKNSAGEFLTRSKWFFTPQDPFGKKVELTYHDESNWKDTYFQSATIGQDFVFEENMLVEAWAKSLINKNYVQGRVLKNGFC